MYGWIKLFADGTKEIGTDTDVRAKKATWQGGRLHDMIGVEMYHGTKYLAILVPGTFWQSEDYEVSFLDSTPQLIVRRIQKQIEPRDTFFITHNKDKIILGPENGRPIPVDENDVGKWITLELDVSSKIVTCSVKETMI